LEILDFISGGKAFENKAMDLGHMEESLKTHLTERFPGAHVLFVPLGTNYW
jgi:hypothetical protein